MRSGTLFAAFVAVVLWGAPAMAASGAGRCLWEALPDGKLTALTMSEEQWGSSDGSMINIVGVDAYIDAFGACGLTDGISADSAGQALDQYVRLLRAERVLAPLFSAKVLDQAFMALPEDSRRRAAGVLQQEATAIVAARMELTAGFLANLKTGRTAELEEYVEAQLAVFSWEVLMPEAVEAEMARQR